MNATGPNEEHLEPEGFYNSLNCIDVVIEMPSELTIRPLTGERRAQLLAEREWLAPWLEALQSQQTPPSENTAPSGKDVEGEVPEQ